VLRAEESTVGTDAINGAGCLEVGRNSLEGWRVCSGVMRND
jgi:hypothetical protein